jgi:hypothetical protein
MLVNDMLMHITNDKLELVVLIIGMAMTTCQSQFGVAIHQLGRREEKISFVWPVVASI